MLQFLKGKVLLTMTQNPNTDKKGKKHTLAHNNKKASAGLVG